MNIGDFLPVSTDDMKARGIEQLDFVYVIGDAYVDHSSFGHAIISRVLESCGFTVGIISQPDWHGCKDFTALGRPRLGFLVTSGNIDPMVNRYTAAKKIRNEDMYSPGGVAGKRPDRADIVYCNRIREAYGDVPIIIGGIEASLRRFAHYDYHSDKVRRSILSDSGADLLTFGMGERSVAEIAGLLDAGVPVSEIKNVRGSVYMEKDSSALPKGSVMLPSYGEVAEDKYRYALATKLQYEEQDPVRGRPLVQLDQDRFVVQNPPGEPLSQRELDGVYELPYAGTYHPSYEKFGGVPAIKEVEFSVTSCRGCFGGCNFCALTLHQGRTVTARSRDSIIREVTGLTKRENFKGYIHDVGGPTADFRHPSCAEQKERGLCKDRQCLFPKPCPNLNADHEDYTELLKAIRRVPGVKKVFVRSGIRFDYVLADKDDTFLRELTAHHISGQLRVAPEHISDDVLYYMGKPKHSVYEKFLKKFDEINSECGKEQYVVPYLMSSHPGCTLKDAVSLAEYLRDKSISPTQVQDFYPTPGSISTCMYHTGIDPRTMEPVYVPKSYEEKQMQRALLRYRDPKNYDLVKKALIKAGRRDLIGYDKRCLIKPYNKYNGKNAENEHGRKSNGKNSQRKNGVGKDKRGTQNRNGGA